MALPGLANLHLEVPEIPVLPVPLAALVDHLNLAHRVSLAALVDLVVLKPIPLAALEDLGGLEDQSVLALREDLVDPEAQVVLGKTDHSQ